MCHEMGIETGIDLDALIECAKLAEDVVGHPAARLGDEGRRFAEVSGVKPSPLVAEGWVGVGR